MSQPLRLRYVKMITDLQIAKETFEHKIKDGSKEYFEFVRHQLAITTTAVENCERSFAKNGDYHCILKLVDMLSKLDLGYTRAIRVVHQMSILSEDILILEERETSIDDLQEK